MHDWTAMLPRTVGWYWCAVLEFGPVPVKVFVEPKHDFLWYATYQGKDYEIEELLAIWYGPVPESSQQPPTLSNAR